MRNQRIHSILLSKYGIDLADKVLDSYLEIENNFFWKKWKPSELDAGHFVEAMRRIIEFELTGSFTPIGQSLSHFNDQALRTYEQLSGHESFRMLIPRLLKSIYNIRNKRGVGHISNISPNEMDATLILYSVKWVIAETLRIATNISPAETQKLLDDVVDRNIDLLWKEGTFKRILDIKMKTKEQILVLLYDESPLIVERLRDIIEYKNPTNFMKIIKELHKQRNIELEGEECTISPKGINETEKIILKYKK